MIDRSCPKCGGVESVQLLCDAICVLHMKSFKAMETNELDNTWLECNECYATSDDSGEYNSELRKRWKDL